MQVDEFFKEIKCLVGKADQATPNSIPANFKDSNPKFVSTFISELNALIGLCRTVEHGSFKSSAERVDALAKGVGATQLFYERHFGQAPLAEDWEGFQLVTATKG